MDELAMMRSVVSVGGIGGNGSRPDKPRRTGKSVHLVIL